jgi:hypothetical protein
MAALAGPCMCAVGFHSHGTWVSDKARQKKNGLGQADSWLVVTLIAAGVVLLYGMLITTLIQEVGRQQCLCGH